MWLRPQEENFQFQISVENELLVATKMRFALGGSLMETFLNLNDSELFRFPSATYAKGFSWFFFLSSFQSLVWFMNVAKGGIKFFLSLAELVLVSLFLVYSVCSSVEVALFHRDVSVWFHLMVGMMPKVTYVDVTCM